MAGERSRDDQRQDVTLLARVPCTISAARRFVGHHHRHSLPPVGGLFAVGIAKGGELVSVGIAGRPVARELDDGCTVKITRCCTVGTPNAASMTYGALCRAGRALGYTLAVTYTRDGEPGTSLRAAGFVPVAVVRADGWDRPGRRRHDVDLFGAPTKPPGAKVRWHRTLWRPTATTRCTGHGRSA